MECGKQGQERQELGTPTYSELFVAYLFKELQFMYDNLPLISARRAQVNLRRIMMRRSESKCVCHLRVFRLLSPNAWSKATLFVNCSASVDQQV